MLVAVKVSMGLTLNIGVQLLGYIKKGLMYRVTGNARVRLPNSKPFYGVCSIMVMPKFVELEDAGSIPVIHPNFVL